METFLIRALQLIMSLSLLILIHEGGHFLFARLFKVRVEKFYMFFDWGFSLFKFKPKNSDTEYGIGWLPLGGYCKISGMIDESMDKEQMKEPAKSWEFRSKPAGQRFLIIVAGVIFNFLLALFIYSMILFTWGESYMLPKDMKMGMQFSEVAQKVGFQNGDILLSADGEELVRFPKAHRQIYNANEVTVQRHGKEAIVQIPKDFMNQLMAANTYLSDCRYPYVIDSIIPNNGYAKAGMQSGDSIIAINGISTPAFNDYMEVVDKLKAAATKDSVKGASRNVTIAYVRAGVTDTVKVQLDSLYKGGAFAYRPDHFFKVVNKEYGFFESFPAGISLGVNTLKGYISDMKYVFTKEGANSLGGFGTIGSIFPAQWDWQRFWEMTAFLSIILAFMNILPIPALDGGHAIFIVYEIIARRKPSEKFMEYAQMVGMFLLFGLLIWANFNDIIRYFFK
nr:RIP metalloprotease RseP [uncultured Bacteroides sp.]